MSRFGTPAAIVDHTVRKPVRNCDGSGQCGSSTTTSWPRSDRTAATAWTAAAHSGATSTPSALFDVTRMRNLPGDTPTSSANGRVGGGATFHAPRSTCDNTSSTAAVSATVRDTTPDVDAEVIASTRFGIRLRLDFRPTSPLHDAGIRIEPPPSEACAIGAMPEATAAPAPPDEPPGVRSGFHGLRLAPRRLDSVTEIVPNSGVVVLPMSTNPALRNRATGGSSSVSGVSGTPRDP